MGTCGRCAPLTAMGRSCSARPTTAIPPGDYRQNEWAGACYTPDGKWLFVNIQTPGVTFAIAGPWHLGPP